LVVDLWIKNKKQRRTAYSPFVNISSPNLLEVRVDGAKEFLSQATKALCYDLGITLKRTEPYEHAQGGKIERYRDVLDSMVRVWLKKASLPKTLWLKAYQGVPYVKNRCINAFLKLELTSYKKR